MNVSYFISKRITKEHSEGFSATIHKIAVASIAVGLSACILSFLIMKGFQETVKNKIFSFSGHLLVTKFTMDNSPEEEPMNFMIPLYLQPEQFSQISHVQEFAHKTGLVKSAEEVLGVVVKGVGKSFNMQSFKPYLVEGTFLSFPDSSYANEVVISKSIARKIKAAPGEDIIIHFFQNPPRTRKLRVVGVYETNLTEYFDNRIVFTDIRLIQRLNDWNDSIAGGLEVFVKNTTERGIDAAGITVGESMDYDLSIERVSDRFIEVFEWLNLLSRQVNILLVIILTVVCVNMISIVIILVMERTQMIGILKALGAHDGFIRRIFLSQGILLIFRGLFFGNLLGLGLCYLQSRFGIVKLKPEDYYMDVVPISWHWDIVLLLNLMVLVVVTLIMLLPTAIISRVNPIKAIRFD